MIPSDTAIRALADADLASADSAECGALLSQARRVRGWLEAREAAITARLRELHARGEAAPAADVHSRWGGTSAAEGRRRQRRSEALDDAPSFGDALAQGVIGSEHVDALADATARLDDDVKTAVLGRADELVVEAQQSTPERFGRSVRDLARRLERDHGISRTHRQRRDTFLSRKLNLATGMTEGRFALLDPELANQIFAAVDREVAAMVAEGTRRGDPEFVERTVDRRRVAAEALGRLTASGHARRRPLEADITVLVDADTLTSGELGEGSVCETGDGAELAPATVQRLVCGGRITPVVIGADHTVLDAGRTIRHANRHQRRALRAMYRACAFGHCDTPFDRCEIHHIVPWEAHGPTDLDNLIPLCSRHHHLAHEAGWHLELRPGRTLVVRQPDGTEHTTRPDVVTRRQRPRTRRRRRRSAA